MMIEGARRFIPKSEWKLDGGRVYLTGGFQPGKIYEVVYRAQDPPVRLVEPLRVLALDGCHTQNSILALLKNRRTDMLHIST